MVGVAACNSRHYSRGLQYKSKTYKTKCFMKLNEKDYENIIKMIVNEGEVVDGPMEYRKDGETLYFQYTYMVGDGFEIDDESIECLGAGGKAVEHDFDVNKVIIEA